MKKQDSVSVKEHITRQQAWDSSRLEQADGAEYRRNGDYTGMKYDMPLFLIKVYCIK
ncbi:MAG: hypothetical protein K2O34_10935 [Acetatifactor sp.]|nr:hypothetical protein [Acetatifactor sp.]